MSDSADVAVVAEAVKLAMLARNALAETMYCLDTVGLQSDDLNAVHSDTAALVATWAGRPIPSRLPDKSPAWIGEAAKEWRARAGRSY